MVLLLLCLLSVSEGNPLYRFGGFAPSGPIPLCANKSLTFCEEVDDYPAELITELLQQKKYALDELLSDDGEEDHDIGKSYPLKPMKPKRTSRSMRRVSESGCRRMKTVRPKLASNRAGHWKFIVQDDKSNQTQEIPVHFCNVGDDCKHCHQFYSQVPMMSINDDGDIFEDMFWMPSSCHCLRNS